MKRSSQPKSVYRQAKVNGKFGALQYASSDSSSPKLARIVKVHGRKGVGCLAAGVE